MKEVPVTLVKANQIMLVLLTALSILFQSTLLVGITLAIIIVSLLFGPKANIAFCIARIFIKRDLTNDQTESIVLLRFNQSIAACLLVATLLLSVVTNHWIIWILVGMVTAAATVALLGFCVGCFLYYQFKRWNYKLSAK